MLSAARYPYMNRAARRDPESFDKGREGVGFAVTGSALLLALLVHAGFMRPELGGGYNVPALLAQPNPIIESIRRRGKSIVSGIKGMFKKLFS